MIVKPFPEAQLPAMWVWLQEFSEQMLDDKCPDSYERMEAYYRYLCSGDGLSYGLMVGDRAVGHIWGEHVGDDIYLGHLVFERYGVPTQEKLSLAREAIAQMFKDGARKIQWQTFAENRAYKIFMQRLGAKVEGVLRQGTRRDGKLRDVLLMASFPEETR